MVIEIIDIHPDDMHYVVKDFVIGKKGELNSSRPNPFDMEWNVVDAVIEGKDYVFIKVKYREV